MSLKERSYSVLIVSSSDSFNTYIKALLPDSEFTFKQFAPTLSGGKRFLLERDFDFIIINSPLSDGTGIRFAIDAGNKNGAVVLLVVKNDIYNEVYEKVSEYGVFSLPLPTTKTILTHSIQWLITAKERMCILENKTVSFEEKMKEIRLVNRAKWVLIDKLKMSEPDAHRYIEKQAMDRCVSKKTIAENIINTYL